jgi:hypothetical protein
MADIRDQIVTTLIEGLSALQRRVDGVAFASDSTNISLDNVAATAFAPAAPSILLAVTQVQQ